MAKKVEINENWEPIEVEDLSNLFVVILKQGSFNNGYIEAFDTDDALMQSAYDSLAKQYNDCGCDDTTKIYLIKIPNTEQTVNMCNTGLFNGSSCDPHVIEATRDLFNRADCEQISCWSGCGLTEGKKKKKVCSSSYCGFTDPALNIAHFNKCMGTGGLQNPDAPHLVVGDTLPNSPVADAGSSSSDGASGNSSSSSGGEGGAMGESLAEALSNVTLDQVLARAKPEYQEIIKNTLLQLKDHYLKLSSEEQNKALDNLVDFVWFNKDFPMPTFEEAAIDPSEAEYYDEKGLANIAIDFVVPPELYASVDESLNEEKGFAIKRNGQAYSQCFKTKEEAEAKKKELNLSDATIEEVNCLAADFEQVKESLKEGVNDRYFICWNKVNPALKKPIIGDEASLRQKFDIVCEVKNIDLERYDFIVFNDTNDGIVYERLMPEAWAENTAYMALRDGDFYREADLHEDIEKEIKIQNNENIIEDEKELDPPIPLETFPNEMGINLCSVKKEKWVQQEDGQLKTITIEFDPATEEEKAEQGELNEATLDYYTQKTKMQALNNGTRGFNAKASSDEKLRFNRRVCQNEGYNIALDIIEAEMVSRNLIKLEDTRKWKAAHPQQQAASTPAPTPAAQPQPQPQPQAAPANPDVSTTGAVLLRHDELTVGLALLVNKHTDAKPIIDYCMAVTGSIRALLYCLIIAICLKKDPAFINQIKEFLTVNCSYTDTQIRETIKDCLGNAEKIERVNVLIKRINDHNEGKNEGLEEDVELDEAKRYVKRYYVRPQNIFCSNKEDILKALLRVEGENCSIYSLKDLPDHDDVQDLKPSDIIYYYDDGILYDKNHVKVMDYDLNVKHEEERKKFADVDAAPDAQVNAVYDDRLTDADLQDKETVANFRAINARQMK